MLNGFSFYGHVNSNNITECSVFSLVLSPYDHRIEINVTFISNLLASNVRLYYLGESGQVQTALMVTKLAKLIDFL